VNLGNPREMTILEFAEQICKLTKSSSSIVRMPLPEDDPGNASRTFQKPGEYSIGSPGFPSKRGSNEPPTSSREMNSPGSTNTGRVIITPEQ